MASTVLVAAGAHGNLNASAQVAAGALTVTIAVSGDATAGRGISGTVELSVDGVAWKPGGAFRCVLGLSAKTGTATGATLTVTLENLGWVRVTVTNLTAAAVSYSVTADVV